MYYIYTHTHNTHTHTHIYIYIYIYIYFYDYGSEILAIHELWLDLSFFDIVVKI